MASTVVAKTFLTITSYSGSIEQYRPVAPFAHKSALYLSQTFTLDQVLLEKREVKVTVKESTNAPTRMAISVCVCAGGGWACNTCALRGLGVDGLKCVSECVNIQTLTSQSAHKLVPACSSLATSFE